MTIDRCLDAGGAFDYASGDCQPPPGVEFVPLLESDVWYRHVLFAAFVPTALMFLLYKFVIRFIPGLESKERDGI